MEAESGMIELLVPLDCWRTTDVPGERATFTAPRGRYKVTSFGREMQLRPVDGGAVYKLDNGKFEAAKVRGDIRVLSA